MNKTIEREFFKACSWFASSSIRWMGQKYNLGLLNHNQELRDDQKRYYEVELSEIIKKQAECSSFIAYYDSPLMDEIETNLRECKSQSPEDVRNYVYSILRPFKEYSNVLNPLAVIERIKKGISDIEKAKISWKELCFNKVVYDAGGRSAGTAQEQITACDESIKEYKEQIERISYISRRFYKISIDSKSDTPERYLGLFLLTINMFANRLDALLLMNNIDLLSLQREIGIYLKPNRSITEVESYIGSYELAKKYIDELSKIEAKGETEEKSLYLGIASCLSKWISDATDEVLESIILNKKVPDGCKKPTWISTHGAKAEAQRFKEFIHGTEAVMKRCFHGLENLKPGNATSINMELSGSIWTTLEKYPRPQLK